MLTAMVTYTAASAAHWALTSVRMGEDQSLGRLLYNEVAQAPRKECVKVASELRPLLPPCESKRSDRRTDGQSV